MVINVARRAAAFKKEIDFFLLVKKYCQFFVFKKQFFCKNEKKGPSRPFFSHPAATLETEFYLVWPYFKVLFLHTFLIKKTPFRSRSMTSRMPVMENVCFYCIWGARNEYKIHEHGIYQSVNIFISFKDISYILLINHIQFRSLQQEATSTNHLTKYY